MSTAKAPSGPEMLEWLETRRSRRVFEDKPVDKEILARLLHAAVTAPSNTNRQPWRFTVVTKHSVRKQIANAVRTRAEEIKAIIKRGHHADDFANYGDFFHEPLDNAAAIVIPQWRDYPDLIADFIASGGGDPAQWHTARSMQAELCSTCAAVMALLLQAHAEGVGACWMAGPMIAKPEIEAMLGIREPFRMVGAIALGWPEGATPPSPGRKPIERVVQWVED
ncbi:MAG: nitroreductase family protein [Polyangiaceae bacterium]|nr:nitroreductase family protein [Polyangiaceae bacterium]